MACTETARSWSSERGARFPHKCAICNQEDELELVEFVFERKKVHVLEAAAVNGVLNAANDVMTGARYTGSVQADIPLCSWHLGRRVRLAGIGVGMTVLAIAVLVIQKSIGFVIVPPGELGFLDIAFYNFIAFGMIFVGITLIFMTIFDSSNLWFKATKYHDRYVWVTGAGAAFLNELPQYENQHRRSRIQDAESRFDDSSDEDRHLTAEELIRRANLDDDE